MATAQASIVFTGAWGRDFAARFTRTARTVFTANTAVVTAAQRPTLNSATITRNGGSAVDVRNEAAIHMLGITDGDTLTINVDHDLDYVAARVATQLAEAARHPTA